MSRRPILWLAVLIIGSACSGVDVKTRSPEGIFNGLEIYAASPYLLVCRTAQGALEMRVVYLPDRQRTYQIRLRNMKWASARFHLELTSEGFLRSIGTGGPASEENARATTAALATLSATAASLGGMPEAGLDEPIFNQGSLVTLRRVPFDPDVSAFVTPPIAGARNICSSCDRRGDSESSACTSDASDASGATRMPQTPQAPQMPQTPQAPRAPQTPQTPPIKITQPDLRSTLLIRDARKMALPYW